MLQISNVSKRFATAEGSGKALDRLSLTIQTGAFFTLFGASGCGKSTLLRCIAGLETADEGEINIAGRMLFSAKSRVSVPTYKRRIGMVFQSYAIWPHLTVFANVAFPLEVQKAPEIRSRVMRSLEVVGLHRFADRDATQLSGGQQQRVALARAIVANPEILLLDEPLSNLDVALREQMRIELSELQRAIGITTVLVTHDQTEALSMSDRIAVMSDGRIVETGSPDDLYHRPQSIVTGRLIGGANIMAGVAAPSNGNGVVVETPIGSLRSSSTATGSVQVMIRPEGIIVAGMDSARSGSPNQFTCLVRVARFTGQLRELELLRQDVPDWPLRCRVDSSLAVAAGDIVEVMIDPSAVHVIPDDRRP